MPLDHYPAGQEMDVTYPEFSVSLTLHSDEKMSFVIKEGLFAHSETVAIVVKPLGRGVFAVSWQEESGATVVNIQDFDRNVVLSFVTLTDGTFLRMEGVIRVTRPAPALSDARPIRNKALVLEAMTSLFQKHDASAVGRLYVEDYIQHNPMIPQGRDALQGIVESLSKDVLYEPGLILADGDFVAIHGRIRGWSDQPQVVVDIFRVENGRLAEHWDVLQSEMPVTSEQGDLAMFSPDERLRQGE